MEHLYRLLRGSGHKAEEGVERKQELEEVGEALWSISFKAYLDPYTCKLETAIITRMRPVETGLLSVISWRRETLTRLTTLWEFMSL